VAGDEGLVRGVLIRNINRSERRHGAFDTLTSSHHVCDAEVRKIRDSKDA
jgi:hypothetical protein